MVSIKTYLTQRCICILTFVDMVLVFDVSKSEGLGGERERNEREKNAGDESKINHKIM